MDMTDAVKQRDAMLVQIRADVAEREQRLRQESLSLRDHVDGVMEPLRSGLDTLRTRVDTELSTVHAAVEELRQKLGDTGVKSLAEVVDEKIGATRDQMTATMADVQTSVGDVAWKQEVFERIALELDQRVVAMDERVG